MTASQYGPGAHFESAEHALIAGMVLGVAMKHGVDLTPVPDNEGNYTNRFEVHDEGFPEGVKVFVNVEPPVKIRRAPMLPPTPAGRE